MNKADRRLVLLMRLYVVLFGVGGFAYLLFPSRVFDVANWLSVALGFSFEPMPQMSERFWLALSFSMMMTITSLAYLVQRDVTKNRGYTIPLMIAKATSSSVYAVLVVLERRFAYLGGFLTDFVLLVATIAVYLPAARAARSPDSGGASANSRP